MSRPVCLHVLYSVMLLTIEVFDNILDRQYRRLNAYTPGISSQRMVMFLEFKAVYSRMHRW